jgi:uncharacterized RDD family membrane protein YckC
VRLELATPERVSMSLPVAGIGYRSLAYLVDLTLLLTFWVLCYFVYALTGPDVLKLVGDMSSVARVASVLGLFFFQWMYWTASEVLWRGQTPGKRLLRIRVVRTDGSPVGVFESAVRNLMRVIDFLPVFYGVGVIAMLVDSKHRRLGDLAAGTVALREEKIDLSSYASAAPAPVTGRPLTPQEHELVRQLNDRFESHEPDARLRLSRQLAQQLGDAPPPDDTSARAWLRGRAS